MTSRSFVALLALFAIVFLPLTAVAETPEGEAVKAAEAWLALVDSGDFLRALLLPHEQMGMLESFPWPGQSSVVMMLLVVWGAMLAYFATLRGYFVRS